MRQRVNPLNRALFAEKQLAACRAELEGTLQEIAILRAAATVRDIENALLTARNNRLSWELWKADDLHETKLCYERTAVLVDAGNGEYCNG